MRYSMDQDVHKRMMLSTRTIGAGLYRHSGWRSGASKILCAGLVILAGAVSVRGQLLMSDNFDIVGNTNGAAPVGWTLTVPSSTSISVVNSTVTAAASSPFCVQFTDSSGSSRPQMYQNFRPEATGRASAMFKVNATGNAPAYLELYTSSGTYLCAVLLDANGLVGYDNTGGGTVDTTIHWTTGTWQTLEIEWYADGTFSGYLGTTQFVQRVSFASSGPPSRILLVCGTNSGTGRAMFVDNVQSVVTQTLDDDDFDSGNTFGGNPSGWVVTEPAGTNLRVVDSSVEAPLSSPYCVEFSDSGASPGPQMYTNFTGMADGRLIYSALIPSTNQAPLDMQLRDTNGNFLVAIRLAENGSMSYNNNPAGNGPFTASSVRWATDAWQTVRVDWFSNYTFSAYLGSNQIVANASFSTNTIPARVLFRQADSTSTSCLAYLDNVLVNHAAFPGAAINTNNATWLGYGYTSTQSYWTNVPQLAFQMMTNYHVGYWFLNVGSLDTNGVLQGSVSSVTNFLKTLKTWENQQGYQFKVFAWVNGDMPYSGGPTTGLNVNISSVASNMVLEAEKLVSTNVAGSYVAKSPRAFDGVQLDLEPAGPNGSDTQFFNIVQIFVSMKNAFKSLGVGDKLTSFTSPTYSTTSTNNNVWHWPPMYYYTMGTNIDLLCAMTYDNGSLATGAAYRNFMQDQTTNILRIVSGKYWNNDAQHPAPTNGVQVMAGFPAFPNSNNHSNVSENITFAAPGVLAGLSDLQSRGDFSTNYFQGAAVYLQADGTGNDGFASYDQDWWWFGQYWLNTWADPGVALAEAVINPSVQDYGTVAVGQTNSQPFLVINTGGLTLTGTATSAAPFAVSTGSPYNVAPGQTQTVTVSFIPTSAGAFTSAVTFASNGGNFTNAVTGVGALAPQASFSGTPTTGTEPLLVTFTDTSTGTISNRFWDFGDSTTTNVTTNSVVHTYAAGTYGVTLVVSGPVGASTNSGPGYITAWTAFQAWQIQYFGSTTNPAAAPGADPDGDGLDNQAEFLAGTDPTNSGSGLRISSVIRQGSDINVIWTTAGGRTNAVQAAPGDVNGGYSTNFTDISGPLVISGSGDATTNYVDPGAVTNTPTRYYRIRLVP